MSTLAPARWRTHLPVPAMLFALTVLAQIAYPLTSGDNRDRLTVLVVLIGAAGSVVHAAVSAGGRGLAAVVAVGVVGWTAEAVGVATGVPFGNYAYSHTLGPEIGGVPGLVVAAWVFMAWPAAVVARRVVRGRVARVAVGAWGLAAWDVFLDPQMVQAGHWSWAPGGYRLPGIADVPVSNFLGWLGVAVVISLLLQTIPGPVDAVAARPAVAFYVWTAFSSTLAAGVFWHRPAVAAWGLLAMGPVAVAAARTLRRP